MERWEIALQKFISKWEKRKDVVGALVCGSFITGNPSTHSDIDIHIMLDSKVNWRERGNEVIDGILIEYFANPARKHYEYAKEDLKSRTKLNSHMFYTGKILFDKTGELKKIVEHSKKDMTKKYPKMNKTQTEISKYHIWDMFDNLEEIFDADGDDFFLVYFSHLKKLFDIYSAFLSFDSIPPHKLYRFLTSNKDKKKYHINDFPDEQFVQMYVDAIAPDNKTKMMKKYKAVTDHVLSKMGGFDINGWKLRISLKR